MKATDHDRLHSTTVSMLSCNDFSKKLYYFEGSEESSGLLNSSNALALSDRARPVRFFGRRLPQNDFRGVALGRLSMSTTLKLAGMLKFGD